MEPKREKQDELTVYWVQAQPAVAGYIHSMVPRFQDADDILQEVALITIEKFSNYDPNKSFIAWAIGIARNRILKYYSNQQRTAVLDLEAVNCIADVYKGNLSEISEYQNRTSQALSDCIGKLKGKWRMLLELYYLREFNLSRISQKLGIAKNNIYVSLHRIRIALRDCVNKELREEAV